MAERTCPVWVGYLLASPVRKLFENPKKILGEYIKEGMTVLDLGCAMGFFSIPAARMVGPNGKIICVDVQEKMIFAFAIAVVHEVPNVDSFFSDTYKALKSNTKFFIAEPKGHVTKEDFKKTISTAEQNGFKIINRPKAGNKLKVLLEKK